MPSRKSAAARGVFVFVWGLFALAMVAAPYLAAHSHSAMAAHLYLFFSPVCHQNPMRSFVLEGCNWAVCQRCSGIYLGALLASILPLGTSAVVGTVERRRIWAIGAMAPLVLDATLPVADIWTNTPWSRFSSGMLFGAMIPTLLLPGITEFLSDAQWPRLRSRRSMLNGGAL